MQTIIRTWCKEEAFGGSQRCVYNFFRDTSSRGKWRPIKSDENFFIEREKKKKKKQYNITHLAFLLMRCKTKKKKKEEKRKKKIREEISYININRSKQKARRDSLLYRLFPFDSTDLWARKCSPACFHESRNMELAFEEQHPRTRKAKEQHYFYAWDRSRSYAFFSLFLVVFFFPPIILYHVLFSTALDELWYDHFFLLLFPIRFISFIVLTNPPQKSPYRNAHCSLFPLFFAVLLRKHYEICSFIRGKS